MKKRTHRSFRWLPVMVLLLFAMQANAQHEPQFTQYMFQETFINPAYAGSHEGWAANTLYRNQWVGLKGAPKTQTVTAHGPINKKKLGIGISMMNESIGVTNQLAVNVDFAYRIIMPRSVLAFGVQGGFVNDQEQYTAVVTTQNGDQQFMQDVHKYFLPNAGVGVYYYINKKFYAGFSIPRLLENKIDVSQSHTVIRNVGNPKVWHYYFATGYVCKLSQDVKFKPSIMVKAVQNAPIEMDMNLNFLFNEFLWTGISYRTGDAISGLLGIQISKQLRVGYSYDYTLSDLQNYNSGSHEISIAYEFASKKHRIVSPRYF